MAALEHISESELEATSRPETPQATQSTPPSTRDLSLQYISLEPSFHSKFRKSSDSNHTQVTSLSVHQSTTLIHQASTSADANSKLTEVTSQNPMNVTSQPTLESQASQSGSIVDFDGVSTGCECASLLSGIPTANFLLDDKTDLSITMDESHFCPAGRTAQDEAPMLLTSASIYTLEEQTDSDHESDTTADLQELFPIPDTPLGISQLQFGSQLSFNTSVRDLIQQNPDVPIGGRPATLTDSFTMSCLPKASLERLANHFEVPSSLKQTVTIDPHNHLVIAGSETCYPVLTASETTVNTRATKATDLSYDGPAGEMAHIGTDRGDFAFKPAKSSTLHECCVSPGTSTPDIPSECDATSTLNAIRGLDGFFEKKVPQETNEPSQEVQQMFGSKKGDGSKKSPENKERTGSKPQHAHSHNNTHNKHAHSQKEPDSAKKEHAQEKKSSVLPVDTTGQNSIPETPLASGKNKPKGPLHRRFRGKILVTPVLSIVIGRQLAKPTRKVLKQAAQTVPDVGDSVAALAVPA